MNLKQMLLLLCGAFFFFLGVTQVSANSGPHGGYTATTDACAGCHRAHTAANSRLLLNQSPALCYSCHDSAAAGASTNVTDGVYDVNGAPLLGGGFSFYQGVAVTSSHSVDNSSQNAWGSGTTWVSTYDCAGCHNPESGLTWPGTPEFGISPGAMPTYPGRGQNVTMPLTCTSCHDPHGGRNYRILQQRLHPPSMQQEDPPGYVLVTSNETGGQNPNQSGYAPDYVNPNYRLGLGDWCTGCHFTYHQTVSVSPFNAEDGKGLITRYRHPMNMNLGALTTTLPLEDPTGDGASANDQVFCLTCHFAHGSNHTASGLAANVAPTNDSALLRIDNRGVCEECHKK
jgi:predicted CXXCH cytochrome family protein